MRPQLPMAARLCFVLFLLLFLSCNKIDLNDLLHHPGKVPQLCDIKKITDYSYSLDTLIATFSYNHQGNPESVVFNHPSTGRPHLYFRYNKQGKITDYYGPYQTGANSSFEFWYRYQYDSQGKKIVGDTLFGFGDMINNQPFPYPLYITTATYEYDQYDRVVKIHRKWVNAPYIPLQTTEYAYDNKGNRTDHVYGDKPNLRRTNKIWMVVDYDYSVNNSLNAVSYNKYGLPLRTDTAWSGSFLYNILLHKAVFEYNCH